MEIVNDPVEHEAADRVPSGTTAAGLVEAGSILDRVRRSGERARKNRHFDLPLPPQVGEGLGLRLGVPTSTTVTLMDDALFDEVGDSQAVADDVALLAHRVTAVTAVVDGKVVAVDGLTLQDLAGAFAKVLTGADVPIATDDDAILWLHREGTPAMVNAQRIAAFSRAYRMWSLSGGHDATDPSEGL